ncbi:MAG: DNA cytosine methyltransferase [Thermoplasmatota archaeon]
MTGPRRPVVVDIFAGAGGFSFGFAESGFDIALAVENFRTACETYAANVPVGSVLNADVRAVERSDFPEAFDVLIGGPPCEAYTVANADRRREPLDRLYKDPLGSLTIRYLQILKMLKPRVFVMENVPQILDGDLRSELHDLFKRAGYPELHENELRAEEHGTPSERRRVFLSNVAIAPPKDPKRTTVWEAIGDLESLDVDIPNHEAMPIRGKRGQKIAELATGDSVYHYRAASGKVHGSWTRLAKDEVAPTVKGLGRFVHPTEDRLLTPREHARLMGYPDDYVFHGGKNDQYNQIGESVPPPLAMAIAREVKKSAALSDAR